MVMASPFTFAAITFLDSSKLFFTISCWCASGAVFASHLCFLACGELNRVINKTIIIAVIVLFLILPPE